MKQNKLLITTISALVIGAFIMTPLASANEENQNLKQEVEQLKQKVKELESALQMKSLPSTKSQASRKRWDPFMEMNQIQDEINNMFQESFIRGAGQNSSMGMLNPATDIQETDKQYIIKIDLPGMEKANINVQVEGERLVVSGEKQSSSETENTVNQYYQKERGVGYFSQSVLLPKDTDKNSVNADYKNGVLTVKIDRLAGAKTKATKKIQIN